MITLVEALNYRCLRYIRQPLDPFHVLVGPNASGKTTFLDVIAFLGRLMSDGVDAAIEERTRNIYDLVWGREGTRFELAVEASIPTELRGRLLEKELGFVRYEVVVGLDPKTQERGIQAERVLLKRIPSYGVGVASRDPRNLDIPESLIERPNPSQAHTSLMTGRDGLVTIYPETDIAFENVGLWGSASTTRRRRSALRTAPIDEAIYPVSSWLVEVLTYGIQKIVLNSLIIGQPSPSGLGPQFRPDGSNLPWIAAELQKRSPERFQQWIAHLQTALPDLRDIRIIERHEDRHLYFFFVYQGGLEVPSWMASEGTLRMLALTLPAYLDNFKGTYLVEEPENGIHPTAIETMTQSLSSVYDAQVLLATHSPIVLSTVEPDQVLCFSKNVEGATEIVRGSEHPALQQWKRETSLGTLFAAGVLG